MEANLQRRSVRFENLDQVIADVRTLLDTGYQRVGKWNLAQVCLHCNEWMRYPMDGFPKAPFPIRQILWLMKITIGRGMLRKIISEGAFKEGTQTDPRTVMEADAATDQAAAEQFFETIERFRDFQEPLHSSPLFGETDRDTALKLHLIHATHHLSFLIPSDRATA